MVLDPDRYGDQPSEEECKALLEKYSPGFQLAVERAAPFPEGCVVFAHVDAKTGAFQISVARSNPVVEVPYPEDPDHMDEAVETLRVELVIHARREVKDEG